MDTKILPNCVAFAGTTAIASGSLLHVAEVTKLELDKGETASVLIFDDATSEPIEIDFRGEVSDVKNRLMDQFVHGTQRTDHQSATNATKGPGRPRLGVVAREVTLLPRHWDWLQLQPGGASVALRKLIDDARKDNAHLDSQRSRTEATYKFMSAMAGNLQNFENATRALFAHDESKFDELIKEWPNDIQHHLKKISKGAFK